MIMHNKGPVVEHVASSGQDHRDVFALDNYPPLLKKKVMYVIMVFLLATKKGGDGDENEKRVTKKSKQKN